MTKKLNLLVAAVGTAAACSFAPRPDVANAAATSAVPEQQRRTNVTRLYVDTCAKCHGENGEGNGGSTKSLISREKYDQANDRPFFDAIKNGVPHMGMEAYGETLSEPEMWALVVHIRELQSKGLRQQFGSPRAEDGVYTSQHHKFRMETVLEGQGLRTPWGVDWLPDGRMLVTNLPGALMVAKDGKVTATVTGTPEVKQLGQGGLMEVAVHPDYARNGWIYLAYTEPAQNGDGGMTKVVRGKLRFSGDSAAWTDQQTIWESPQEFYSGAGIHFGSRIVFDGKGHLFFPVGERGTNMRVQDEDVPYGRIYRLNDDGTVPKDNPWVGKKKFEGAWSYGHRNPQGLVFDLDGNLWDTEHAPRGGDEVNRIVKGANYGWPIVSFGINYNDSPFVTPWPKPEQNITQPVFRWLPSTGACGLDLAKGPAFAKWKGDLIAGGLSGQNVDRLRIKDDKIVEREELIQGQGRVRDVSTAKDGTIYVTFNQPDKIVRLVPAD